MTTKNSVGRKSLSLLLSVLMVFASVAVSFDVFKTTSAAANGTYFFAVKLHWDDSVSSRKNEQFSLKYNSNDSTNGNGRGGENWITCSGSDWINNKDYTWTGSVNGFPSGLRIKATSTKRGTDKVEYHVYLSVGSTQAEANSRLNSGNYILSKNNSHTISKYANKTMDDTYGVDGNNFPKATITLSGGSSSIKVPSSGTSYGTAYSVSAKDQYNVGWVVTPSLSVSNSLSVNANRIAVPSSANNNGTDYNVTVTASLPANSNGNKTSTCSVLARHTLSVAGNGGTANPTSYSNKYTGEKVTLSASRTGYHISSWTKTSGNGSVSGSSFTFGNNNAAVRADWAANAYSVKFNSNGGSGTMSDESFTYGTAKALTANSFSRTGYTFSGWNTKSDGSGTSYSDRQTVNNLSSTNGAAVTLYAKWTANKYTVTFDGQGVSANPSQVSAVYGSAMPKVTAVSRTGYTFGGYYTGKNGTGTKYYNADGTSANNMANAGNMTLYAMWTANNYNVTFDSQGGSQVNSVTAKYDSAMPSITAPTRTGYKFSGFYTSANGQGTKYYNADGTSAKNMTNAGALKLYASWYENSYKITFDKNGADGADFSKTLKYSQSYTIPENTFTKTGCTFTGWNTSSDGNGKMYAPGTTVSKLLSDDNAEIKLYAVWEANTYTVALDGNGADKYVSSVKAVYDSVMPTIDVPERKGYIFGGYFDSNSKQYYLSDGTSSVKMDVASDSLKLTAKWTPVSYTLTLYANYGENETKSVSMTYDKPYTLSEDAFSRTGYTFLKWNASSDGKGTSYNKNAEIENLSSSEGGEVKLYAQWKANEYTLTVHGYNGVEVSKKCVYDEKFNIPSMPDYAGVTYTGVSDSENGTKKYELSEEVENLSSADGASVNLYTLYTLNEYTIKVKVLSDLSSEPIYSGEVKGNIESDDINLLTYKSMIPKGYTFSGYTAGIQSDISGDSYKFSASDDFVTVNCTANKYVLNVDLDGGLYSENKETSVVFKDNHIGETIQLADSSKTGYEFKGYELVSDSGDGKLEKTSSGYKYTFGDGAAQIKAVFEYIPYSLTYNYAYSRDGGLTYTVDDSETVVTGKTYHIFNSANYTLGVDSQSLDSDLAKTGYTFDGWYDENGSIISDSVYKFSDHDGKVTAKFTAVDYSATVIPDDGTYQEAKPAEYSGNVSFEKQHVGDTITLNTPSLTGYDFVKWTASDGTELKDDGNGNFEYTFTDHSVTFTAVYQIKPVTLTLTDADGNEIVYSTYVCQTVTLANPKTMTTSDGKVFAYYKITEGEKRNIDDNVYVSGGIDEKGEAVYIDNSFTLTVNTDAENVTYTGEKTYSGSYGGKIRIPQPKRTGYLFSGWKVTTAEEDVVNKANEGYVKANSYIFGTGSASIEPMWTPNTYYIHYSSNGGSGSAGDSAFVYDKEGTLKENPFTRDHYIFTGWNTKSDGTGESYEAGVPVKNVANSGTKTLFAQWKFDETNPYKLNVDADGGTLAAGTSFTGNPGDSVELGKPVKEGYRFVAWRVSGGTINKTTFTFTNGDATVKAVYEKIDESNSGNSSSSSDSGTGGDSHDGGSSSGGSGKFVNFSFWSVILKIFREIMDMFSKIFKK